MMKHTCDFIVLILAISFYGLAHTKDGKTPVDRGTPPFIQTEAERWVFDHQIKYFLRQYMESLQLNARNVIDGREQTQAKLSDHTSSIYIENGERWQAELNLKDGWMEGLHNIEISFVDVLAYENLDVVFTCDVKFPENIKIVHDFTVLKDGIEYCNGRTLGRLGDLNFLLKARLDLSGKRIKVQELERRCLSGVVVDVEGLSVNQERVAGEIIKIVMELCGGQVMDDIEMLTRNALEGALDKLGRMDLPIYDYGKNYVEGNAVHQRPSNITLCLGNAENVAAVPKIIKSGINLMIHRHLPFIQNDAEMWNFEEQLKYNINEYLDHLLLKAMNNLLERGLKQAKLPDFERSFNGYDGSEVDQSGSLKLTNGWVSGIHNFATNGADMLIFHKKLMTISASIHLYEDMEFNQDFLVNVRRADYSGSIHGKVKSMSYKVKVLVDLETFNTTLKDLHLECIGGTRVYVSGVGANDNWLTKGVSNAATALFNGPVLDDVDKLLHQAFEYTIRKTEVQGYLPKWNYKRNYNSRLYVKPKHKLMLCNDTELSAALNREYERGYNTVVKHNPVPFINTELELRTFGEQLAVSMNKYLKSMLHETSNIITLQRLEETKLPAYVRPLSAKDFSGINRFGLLSFINGVIGDISDIFQGTDLIQNLEFDAKDIIITARIPIWWNLKFYSEIVVSIKNHDTRGTLIGMLNSVVYYVKIRLDYLGSKNVTVEELYLDCVGGLRMWAKDIEHRNSWLVSTVLDRSTSFFTRVIWRNTHAIFRRSLEDAISNNDLGTFLPEWDYSKDYSREKPSNTKLSNGLRFCSTITPNGPTIEAAYNDVKAVGFEEILPLVRTEALRINIKENIKEYVYHYLKDIWNSAKDALSKRYAQSKLPDVNISLKVKDHSGEEGNISLFLSKGSILGILSANALHVADMMYGENNTIFLLSTENFNSIKVEHDFILNTSGVNLHGSVVVTAESVKNILKSRFVVESNRIIIEDYDLYCVNAVTREVKGLTEEFAWLSEVIARETIELSMVPVLKDFLIEMTDVFEDTVQKEKGKFYLPSYIYDKDLYKIAIQNDNYPNTQETRIEKARNCHTTETETSGGEQLNYRKYLPFIGAEAEWWYFNKEMKIKMKSLKRNVMQGVSDYLVRNNFEKINLPDFTRNFSVEDPFGGMWNADLAAQSGSAESFSDVDTDENTLFEYGKNEVIIQLHLGFKNKIKFHHEFNINIMDNVQHGIINGFVEELAYTCKVRINLETKHVGLEDPELNCIRGVIVEVEGLRDSARWLADRISAVANDVFVEHTLDDVKKILHLALQDKISSLNEGRLELLYLPEWNYEKNYGVIKIGGKRDLNICNQATAEQTAGTSSDLSRR